MTFEDAKDAIAKRHGYKTWRDMGKTLGACPPIRLEEAVEFYAACKVEEYKLKQLLNNVKN